MMAWLKGSMFMNDDHFLLKDMEISEIPDYYEGTLEDKIKKKRDWSLRYSHEKHS